MAKDNLHPEFKGIFNMHGIKTEVEETPEPKQKSSIIVRPCYESDGEVWRPERPRFIGEIYVYNQLAYRSSDFDCEHSAFIACAKHIAWYQRKYDCNFFIDGYKNDLKTHTAGS